MKKIVISGIKFYQIFLSVLLKNLLGVKTFCRFTPSCSEYSKTVILKEGVFKGGYLSVLRIVKCQPFKK